MPFNRVIDQLKDLTDHLRIGILVLIFFQHLIKAFIECIEYIIDITVVKVECSAADIHRITDSAYRQFIVFFYKQLLHDFLFDLPGGGLVGCELAYDEVKKGKKVTVVEALDSIMAAGAAAPLPNLMMQAEFAARGVNLLINTKVSEFCDDGVIVETAEGTKKIEADTVVNALGFRPENKLCSDLEGSGLNVYAVGDVNKPANILQAVAEAYAAANSI